MRSSLIGRLTEVGRMPPEPLEIIGGFGGILWALCYVALVSRRGHLVAAYSGLEALPRFGQGVLVAVSAMGGILQMLAAVHNDARIRATVDVAMAVFWVVIALYVCTAIGITPALAVYTILVLLSLGASLMLRASGHVRL